MKYIKRSVEPLIAAALKRNKSVLLLGARQTGKTTLINRFRSALSISFVQPDVRQRYEKDPSILRGEVEALDRSKRSIRPLVLLDEVQKVPQVLDVVQDLIDREIANFILTGSSARKLRRGTQVNLLPGRVISLKLNPFTLNELSSTSLNELMLYGALPGILQVSDEDDREVDLGSYVTTYLEEEVRAEAVVRNLGLFAKFLELAASESGQIVNFRKLSQEIGVSHTTISAYYQILEDCLVAERFEPLTKSRTRKKLTKAHKYIFFDLGVRRLASGEGTKPPKHMLGYLFEQWVGLELVRCSQLSKTKTKIKFWRDPDGPEVDWIIERENNYVPIEVKWTASPSNRDIKHLRVFLDEYPNTEYAYLVCRTPRKISLGKKVYAIPWDNVDTLVFD